MATMTGITGNDFIYGYDGQDTLTSLDRSGSTAASVLAILQNAPTLI